ncbi:MAG: NB-ARC domain-containing protein [Chloroflexota bacterium]
MSNTTATTGHQLFLSYARSDDEPFVKRLHKDLTAHGFIIWWDRTSMPNRGSPFLQEIRDAIDMADRFVLVAGEGAFKSDYVRTEWEYALSICKPVNIILRKCDYQNLPSVLANYDAPDFRDDTVYAERFETLLRQLNDQNAPLGALIGIPELPNKFLPRPADIAKLRELVITDINKPTVISAEKRTTAVQGMGGIGKSVLAAAFACDCGIRRAFPDGIIWLTVGQNHSNRLLYQELGIKLDDNLNNYPTDENTCRASAQKVLSGKHCLIILDDVWELPVSRAFRDLIAGMPARLLITTRNLQINDLLGAQEHRLDFLDETQSVELLKSWVGRDDPDLSKVAKALGYLPLGLMLAGATMYRDTLSGAEYVIKFGSC